MRIMMYLLVITQDLLKTYQITNKILGRGTFAEVREALHKPTGKLLAVKIIDKHIENEKKAKSALAAIRTEIDILKALRHV